MGPEARATGAGLLVLGLALLLLGGLLRAGQADLRDLSALRVVEADVVDVDERRKGPDLLEVVYPVEGQGPRRARVPHAEQSPREGPRVTTGSRVAVAYVPGDPARVRPVDGWSPRYHLPLTVGVVLAPAGALLLALGLLSRRRAGRYELDGALPAAVDDPGLGRRLVRSSRGALALLATPLLVVAPVALLAPLLDGRRGGPALLLVLGGTLLLAAAVPGAVWWAYGGDGVWATPTHLVARHRGLVRRWPWQDVLELGIVVEGRATLPAARVVHGDPDLTPADWSTLARPLLGPLAAHLFARRFREIAAERGIPLAEGLGRHDLADRWLARVRRPPRRAA